MRYSHTIYLWPGVHGNLHNSASQVLRLRHKPPRLCLVLFFFACSCWLLQLQVWNIWGKKENPWSSPWSHPMGLQVAMPSLSLSSSLCFMFRVFTFAKQERWGKWVSSVYQKPSWNTFERRETHLLVISPLHKPLLPCVHFWFLVLTI